MTHAELVNEITSLHKGIVERNEKIEKLTNALTGVYWVVSESGLDWKSKRYADVLKEIHDALEAVGKCPEWLL